MEKLTSGTGETASRAIATDWRWRAAVVLCLLSGAAALGHQLLWTRRMIDLLGASAESTSRVFGVFFLGLALGSAVALALVRRARRPWLWIAAAEVVILILAIPVYLFPIWGDWIWPLLGPERLTSSLGSWVKLLLSVGLLLPPSFAMGWFLPFLAAAMLRDGRTLQRQGVSLYGWNTLGGVAGLGLTVAFFLPLLGAGGAAGAVLMLNALTAAGAMYLNRGYAVLVIPERAQGDSDPASSIMRQPMLLGLAFLSGFGVLALEVIAFQMLMLVAPLSYYAPAGILWCVILVLGLAAFAAKGLAGRFSLERLVPASLFMTALLAAILPFLFYIVAMWSGGLPPAPTFGGFLLRLGVFVLVVGGPLFFVAGLLFPLLTAWSGERIGDETGRAWGGILAINGVGGLLGAEVAHGLLLPAAGPFGAAWIVGAVYAGAAAVFLAAGVRDRGRLRIRLAMTAVVGILLALLYGPAQSLSPVNPHLRLEVLEQRSGREGVLAVVQRPDFGRGLLIYNQYMLGTTSARFDQERQAHLPLLLHPSPGRVAFIGLATGITPGAALLHGAVEEVTAIELSSMVADAARIHFGEYNHGLFEDPRSRIVIEDGRTYMAAARDRFDVVVGDLFLPWGPGEARLYSREHFAEVRSSLRTGGIFCQWLALYQLRSEDLEIILRTFQEVFGEVYLAVNTFRPEGAAVALIGFREGDLDWAAAAERVERERARFVLGDPSVRHVAGLQMLFLGRAPKLTEGPINTLNNLRIELAASRERVTGDPGSKYLEGPRWLEWNVGWRERQADDAVIPAGPRQAGRILTEREVRMRMNRPFSPGEENRLLDVFPAEMLRDPEADWQQWPGTPLRLRN